MDSPHICVYSPPLPLSQGKKSKVSTSRQTQVATNTLSKAAFLLTVLSERLELHNLAFNMGMFSLELQRPPASTKALEVTGPWPRPPPSCWLTLA